MRRSNRRPGRRNGDSAAFDFAQLRRLLGFVRPYRWYFTVGLIATAFAGLLGLALPLLARDLFNRAFSAASRGAESARLGDVVLLLVIIFLVQAAFNFLRVYVMGVVGEGVVADMRRDLFDRLLELPVPFFETRRTGEITSRLTADVSTVQSTVAQGLAELLNQALIMLGATVVLFYLNARLTLVMLAIIPPVMVAAALFGRRLRRTSTRFQDSVAEASAFAEEALVGIRVVKSFGAERLERERYGRAVRRSFDFGRARARARALFIPSMILAMFTGVTLVLWYGGQQVLAGTLAPGDLVAFLVLMLMVAASTGSFTDLYSQLQEAIGASRRIFEILELEGEPGLAGRASEHPPAPLAVEGRIAFEGVDFRYGDRGDALVLRDIDLVAQPGTVTALVGPSGAGKSTLISLLPRFYDPTAGRLTLDGRDLRDFDLRELRGLIAMVPQETQLFSGTVAENIRYGRPLAEDADIEEAARAANALEFVREFPDGFDTVVGERGLKLSGGQRQRLAIARALLKDPRILILDEATSSLDSESEALVQGALDRLMRGRTVFVIAHRLATVLRADQIVVLDRGMVVQRGDHRSLLEQGGLYAQLYRLQFEIEERAREVR